MKISKGVTLEFGIKIFDKSIFSGIAQIIFHLKRIGLKFQPNFLILVKINSKFQKIIEIEIFEVVIYVLKIL